MLQIANFQIYDVQTLELPKLILSAGLRRSRPSSRLLNWTLVCGGILLTHSAQRLSKTKHRNEFILNVKFHIYRHSSDKYGEHDLEHLCFRLHLLYS